MVTTTIGRLGNILGPQEALDVLPSDLAKVPCWDKATPAEWRRLHVVTDVGYCWHLQFDAAHGFRKMLFLWRSPSDRRAIWDYLTRPGQ